MQVLSDTLVDLSRFQFAFTAMFHFIFVPLTLGLTWLMVAMEACYLVTGKVVYRDMTQFWGKLLAINFAVGVLTGITMEFEFGLNWAYFSRLIGGSFGPILAIEGITAFMLEATMFGLFFFTWNKVSKGTHFLITCLLAFGATLSIVNILAANSWMQHPLASQFNFQEMSIELKSIAMLYLNMLAQVRIGHVAFASFLTASMFVMGISAFYILYNRDVGFGKRSFAMAAGFGLVCAIATVFYGDENGLQLVATSPVKMAAVEAQWTTQKAPAAWYLIAFPDQQQQKNYFTVKIPYALSLIATHSLTGTVEGAKEIQVRYRKWVKEGQAAYLALLRLRQGDVTAENKAIFEKYRDHIGFGMLLQRFTKDISQATDADVAKAAAYALPSFMVSFWTFRVMIGCWLLMFFLVTLGCIFSFRNTLHKHPRYLRIMVYSIPLPWIAAESGWLLAEVGRQPWSVQYIMPTFIGPSSITVGQIITSLSLFIIFYAVMFAIEMFLMFKYARLGPSALHTGRYHHEKINGGKS